MGQVPASAPISPSYLLIGSGRVARHLAHYFTLESIPFATWSRTPAAPPSMGHVIHDLRDNVATHILLAVSDPAIEGFLEQNSCFKDRICVHFSGALTIKGAQGTHPLMTFGTQLYSREIYREIPFVVERGARTFHELLPGLSNPFYTIAAEQKTLYHALCVLSGNFSVLLWEKAFHDFSERLGLPKEVLLPYLRQTTANLIEAGVGQSVLSGPLVRRDHATVDRHLAALSGDPFQNVYRAMVEAYFATPARTTIAEHSKETL